jgi:hypothetical protein
MSGIACRFSLKTGIMEIGLFSCRIKNDCSMQSKHSRYLRPLSRQIKDDDDDMEGCQDIFLTFTYLSHALAIWNKSFRCSSSSSCWIRNQLIIVTVCFYTRLFFTNQRTGRYLWTKTQWCSFNDDRLDR